MAASMFGRFLQNTIRTALRSGIRPVRRYAKGKGKGGGKHKIYLTRQLDKAAMKYLHKHCEVTSYKGKGAVPREELLKHCVDQDGLLILLTDKIDQEVLDTAGSKLKVISTMSVGFDHLDLPAIHAKNIKIGYTPGVLTAATAEMTIGLMLCVGRRIIEASEEAECGGWTTWAPYFMCGPGIKDKTIGIVGCGAIGAAVAARVYPFEPKEILYWSRTRKKHVETDVCARKVSFDELLQKSDYVICLLSLNKHTRDIFNEEAFSKMKKGAIFVNTARGNNVVTEALIDALKEKRIGGAGLDVTVPEPLPLDSPLFKMSNVVVLPHVASATYLTRNNMAMLAVKNLINGLNGKKMPRQLMEKSQ